MSREAMSEDERRRRRNEASRRCYLRRKAELAAQAQPVGAKNKKPKAKAVEAKPARTKPAQAKPTRRGPDPVVAAERLCKTYARVAGGIKPMLKDAAEFLGIVYKSEDQRVVEKVERILAKGLGVSFAGTPSDPLEKTRVCLDAVSKTVKTPKFRLTVDTAATAEPEPLPEASAEPEPENDEPAEVPVDPALLEKVDAGEADKSEIEIPQDKDGKSDEDDEDDSDLDGDDESENEDEDDDEDDEDDESEEAQERRARRREREESNNVREYESGRWEMMGEMGAQGAFDD